ncbi:MAG: hypothetical protein U0350_19690 [Caldilineaceae bacterium]
MKAFLVMGRTLKAAYDDLFLCVFLSIAFWVGTLALPLIFNWLARMVNLPLNVVAPVTLLLMLPAAPVTTGIQKATNRIANYLRVDNSFFWEGTRQYIGKGFLLFAINLLAPAAIIFNIWFYFNSQGWLPIIGVAWIWLLLLWLLMGQYTFPLFWQQDSPDLKLVLRNSALLAVRHPLYSLLMLLFQIVLLLASTALTLPLILLAPGLIALAGNFALAGLLQELGLAPQPPETPVKGG